MLLKPVHDDPMRYLMTSETRRHRRFPSIGPVRISWQEHGETRYARGKCLEVSAGGLRLELPAPVAVRTEIYLSAERIGISGTARVRHITRYGAKYLAGVELSRELADAAIEAEIAHSLVVAW